jgi:hypothetical protein
LYLAPGAPSRGKTNDKSDGHLPQPQKQIVTSFVFIYFLEKGYRIFGRFVTREFKKHGAILFSGLIKTIVPFFLLVPPPLP